MSLKQLLPTRTDKKWIVFLFVFLLFLTVLYALTYEISKWTGLPLETFTRDTFAVAEVPVYTGIISNLGVLFWAATSVICAFSCFAGWHAADAGKLRGMLLYTAIFSFVLMLDDFFMLHESVLPQRLGIPEKYVFLVYILIAIFFVYRYRFQYYNSRIWILFIAFSGFFLSMSIDSMYLFHIEEYWRIVVFENFFKLVGVGSWMVYFAIRGREYLLYMTKVHQKTI